MRNWCATTAVLMLLLSCHVLAQDTLSIQLPEGLNTSPLKHAANRLSDYTKIPISTSGQRRVRLDIPHSHNSRVGEQGYRIRNKGKDIVISANTETGLANGVYTLLRTLMIEHSRNPFTKRWNIEEEPHFSFRAMQVAPYRFGGSYGFAVLSPDRWTIEEWRRYLDTMRLVNMTTLSLVHARMYDPAYPRSEREKWRYDVWKQVMEYCHQIGLRFHWMNAPNLVSQQAFWDHPDKRAEQSELFWYGNGLDWNRGKDVILENAKYTLEHFKGLDGLELIFSDGGAFSLTEDTDPAAYIADATLSYRQLLRETDNDADFIYWNWILDIWTRVHMSEETLQKFPKYRTMQDDVVPLLPKDIGWLDASMLTLITTHWHWIQNADNPPLREGLLIGKEAGFKPVIDFFWYMNPEFSINMFPHPFIGRGIQEARYAHDEIEADGVMGYRLAPTLKFVDDYIFFRLASDPSLTQQQLINEAAAMLTDSSETGKQVAKAIGLLEQFWTDGYKLKYLETADQILRKVIASQSSQELEYLSNGVTFLVYIVRLAQPGLSENEKNALKIELYRTVRGMYVFQGLVADIVWLGEALRMFNTRVDWMVEEYQSVFYAGSPYPEVIDRSIYPKASSKPTAFKWPKVEGATESSKGHNFYGDGKAK